MFEYIENYKRKEKLICYIDNYISENLVEESCNSSSEKSSRSNEIYLNQQTMNSSFVTLEQERSIQENIKNKCKNFRDTLLDFIDNSGMTDAECYKKANVSRQTFSKIKNVESYMPSKETILMFCIALELDIDSTRHLLSTAGLSLSPSNKFDLVVEYFIKIGNYDIEDINYILYKVTKQTFRNVSE